MRKMISFKVENLPPKQQKIVNDWADGQASIQQSLANIIMHVVEFTGNTDVMDFEVQRQLHTIFNNSVARNAESESAAPSSVYQETKSELKLEKETKPNDIYKSAGAIFEDED